MVSLFSAAPAYTNAALATRTADLVWTSPAAWTIFDNAKINVLGATSATVAPASDLKTWFDSNATMFDTLKKA
jgi:hypothetical protein